jgi:penicillin-binding protein 2
MQNRPVNLFHEAEPQPGLRESYALDRNPWLRLAVVFVGLSLPLLVVAGKLVHLQSAHGDLYVEGFGDTVSETFRTIETSDGRIVMGGTVLAQDVASYRLKMHYRWLEEPADGVWLRRKARERLPKSQRRDRDLLEAAEQAVLADRLRMWQRLAEQLRLTDEEFAERRDRVQQRVERIVALVVRNRERRDAESAAELQRERDAQEQQRDWLESGWQTVREELTTPPKRRRREPVEITEEFDYHVLVDDLSFDQVATIVSRSDLFPGVDYEMVTRRDYPQGPLAAHIVGSRQPVDADEIAAMNSANDASLASLDLSSDELAAESNGGSAVTTLDDLRPGDRIGRSGIEQSYSDQLRGRRGLVRIVKDSDGEIIRREVLRKPLKGADVELSVIRPLQQFAESLLDDALGSKPLLHSRARSWQREDPVTEADRGEADGESAAADETREEGDAPQGRPRGGCIVALNVYTGEILCAAAAPRFDLRLLTDYDEELWKAVQTDPRSPMFPRVTQMAIPPGSVFKTLTTIAGLEDRVISADEPIYCRGYFETPKRHRCYVFRHRGYGHGDMTLTRAISRSCNVYFYNVGKRLGPDRLAFWSRRMGFGRRTGIDLPGESAGNVPEPGTRQAIQLAAYQAEIDSTQQGVWHSGETLNFAIGQSTLAVTPLQIVRLISAVANGGELVTPHVVRRVLQSSQPEFAPASNQIRDRVPLRPETLAHLREGMEQVVTGGTGRRVFLKDVAIAGKTGTAETGQSSDHAWFTGYAPADSPQVAFVVVLEHGGSGGAEAGPLAKQLVEEMLKQRLIAPTEPLLD